MIYATYDDYINLYLLGRAEVIPRSEFEYWARCASESVDLFTFGRLRDGEVFRANIESVVLCVCEVSEAVYRYENPESVPELAGESVGAGGWSVSYQTRERRDSDMQRRYKAIVTKHLALTGLMFAGV